MSRGHKRARREPIGWKEHREQGWANEGDAEHVLRETHAVEKHRNTRTQDGNSKHKTQKTKKNQGKETKADFFYNAWQVIALKVVFPPPLAKVRFLLTVCVSGCCGFMSEWWMTRLQLSRMWSPLNCTMPGTAQYPTDTALHAPRDIF